MRHIRGIAQYIKERDRSTSWLSGGRDMPDSVKTVAFCILLVLSLPFLILAFGSLAIAQVLIERGVS